MIESDKMPVVGYSLMGMDAKRKFEMPAGQIDIDSTPKFISVAEKEHPVFKDKGLLSIIFEFRTNYGKDFGSVTLNGEVVYMSDDAKKIAKEWNKNKQLPALVDAEVRNFLFRKCLTIIMNTAEEMQLPPPIAFPFIIPQKDAEKEESKQKYIG